MTDLTKLQLRALARKLIDDIDEMYSVRLSPAQYDDAVTRIEDAFDKAADLLLVPARIGRRYTRPSFTIDPDS